MLPPGSGCPRPAVLVGRWKFTAALPRFGRRHRRKRAASRPGGCAPVHLRRIHRHGEQRPPACLRIFLIRDRFARRLDPNPEPRLAELEHRCREAGLPLTVQRRLVLSCMLARTDHPTAEDVFQDVARKLPGVSRGTVYRALDTLVGLGAIHRVCHPGSAARYDAKLHRHHHLICDRCGGMSDLEAPGLDDLRVPDLGELGFAVRDYSVQFRGICRRCASGPVGRANEA